MNMLTWHRFLLVIALVCFGVIVHGIYTTVNTPSERRIYRENLECKGTKTETFCMRDGVLYKLVPADQSPITKTKLKVMV